MIIEQIFYAITITVTEVLTVLTLQRLLSGWWRQYYLLGLVLVLGLAGVVPPIASYVTYGNWSLVSARKLYWILAFALQVATSLLVLQFIYRVGRETPAKATLVRLLALGSLLATLISICIHFDKRFNALLSSVTRDMTFLNAILNMILWRFLIQVRKRDFLLCPIQR